MSDLKDLKYLPTEIWRQIVGELPPPDLWSLSKVVKRDSYSITDQQEQLSRFWGYLLPKGSIDQVKAIIDLGLDLTLLGPDIRKAVHETLTRTPDSRAQKPYLALAVLGHNYHTSTSAVFEEFRSLFDTKSINEFYEIEYSNVTLNVSSVFNPGAGILIRESRRLLVGSKVQSLNYKRPDICAIKVETLAGGEIKCFVMRDVKEAPLIRTLKNNIGRSHFHPG